MTGPVTRRLLRLALVHLWAFAFLAGASTSYHAPEPRQTVCIDVQQGLTPHHCPTG